MKIALFSDIHANLPALEAVLADIDRQQPDQIYCLGDLVGYAPWPNEVIGHIRARAIPTIAGNHDQHIGQMAGNVSAEVDAGSSIGKRSMAFTNGAVGSLERRFLRGLPLQLLLHFEMGQMLLVHGSPRRIDEYLNVDHPETDLLDMMKGVGADLLIFGHTHQPFHRKLAYSKEGTTYYRHAINIGSVGKPKDGDPRAGYVLLHLDDNYSSRDADSLYVQFIRVAYDVEKAARAIEESPLPNEFADMLRKAY